MRRVFFFFFLTSRILDQLVLWTKNWWIKFNGDECKVLHVGENNPEYKYFMDGRELECPEAERNLRAIVNEDLLAFTL